MKELKNIEITHISLVKAGANGKTTIYKSAGETPYERIIKIANADEQGVVVGIVYSPNSEDSQGDFATAEEIRKAAYSFMKAARTANVDKDHDFENKDAFVAESYIVQKGDPTFPNDAGAWAVAIQLESDALKEAVKKGEIAGLSMAGKAERTEVKKDDYAAKSLIDALTGAMKTVWVELRGEITKSKQGDKMEEAALNKALTEALEPITKELSAVKTENQSLKTELAKVNETLSKSKQDTTVETVVKSKFEGVL